MWYLNPFGRAQVSAGLDIHRHNVLKHGRQINLKQVLPENAVTSQQATRHNSQASTLPQEPAGDL